MNKADARGLVAGLVDGVVKSWRKDTDGLTAPTSVEAIAIVRDVMHDTQLAFASKHPDEYELRNSEEAFTAVFEALDELTP